jgi:uncharacterized membrane protein YagU involved in acid resistance
MKVLAAILIGGLLAGAGDIAYAALHYNLVYQTPPQRIFQSVAAGLLGSEAAQSGGWNTASLGLAAHFALTIIMAAVFVVASLMVPLLRKLWWITGPVYGLALLFVMNYLVVPMSRVGGPGKLPEGQFLYGAIFAHVILVGLVIAAAARFTLGDGGGKASAEAPPA